MTTRTKLRIYTLVVAIVLLGGICLILFPATGEVSKSIGTSLVASGIVGCLDLAYRRIIDENASRADEILNSGLTAIYNRRDIDAYHQLMSSVSSRLDITGYSLRNFYDSFNHVLRERLRNSPRLRVRFLVVDPTSPHSIEREALEGHAPGTFANSIELLKQTFKDFEGVEARAYPGGLTTMVFRIDERMFVGPQFLSAASKATVTLEADRHGDSWLFQAYEREFEAMWSKASTI